MIYCERESENCFAEVCHGLLDGLLWQAPEDGGAGNVIARLISLSSVP